MNKLKAIVVDDERLARKELILMLKEFNNISVVAEADDVNSAAIEIKAHNPDVIFLDIQMPGKSGFDLLNSIDINAKVIFVTAFDEFAIRAFEINALDYLLKPINPERLKLSIERLETKEFNDEDSVKLLNYDDHLMLNVSSKLKFVRIDSIVSITAAGDYSNIIYADGKKGLTLKTMKEWEKRLPQKHFCRIHRSHIVNLNFIDYLEEWFNNSYKVYLINGIEPLVMSRRYVAQLKSKMA
jgi:two-component system, LytTR family, response regulator